MPQVASSLFQCQMNVNNSYYLPISLNFVFGISIYFIAHFDRTSRILSEMVSRQCTEQLSTALEAVVRLVQERNLTRLRELFNLCDDTDFTHQYDEHVLYEALNVHIATWIQYNK